MRNGHDCRGRFWWRARTKNIRVPAVRAYREAAETAFASRRVGPPQLAASFMQTYPRRSGELHEGAGPVDRELAASDRKVEGQLCIPPGEVNRADILVINQQSRSGSPGVKNVG
jgi:hypothetical protein